MIIRQAERLRGPAVTAKPSPYRLQRKCACGSHTPGGGTCASCAEKESSLRHDAPQARAARSVSPILQDVLRLSGRPLDPAIRAVTESRFGRDFSNTPAKARGMSPEGSDEEKPAPQQGSATIQCDGSGDYELVYNGWAGAACGTKDCVTVHESSHREDWKAKWPKGCVGQPRGYLPKGDPPDDPLMTAEEYKKFLKESECKAHTADLACAELLPKPAECKQTVEDYVKLTKDQKANWCPPMSRGAKIGLGILGGGLAGAGIGGLIGGLPGAGIGFLVGALVGGIAGALL